MLKISLMALSLLLLPAATKFYPAITTASLIIIMLFALTTMMSGSSFIMISKMSCMDLMTMTLILLTLWVSSMMIIASMSIFNKNTQPKSFTIMVLTLNIILIMCFSASNMFLFYIWFEASLIPTMALIMLWGYQPERLQASMYLMIYTVTASLPMLMMFGKIYSCSKTSCMPSSMLVFPQELSPLALAWLLTLGGFMVKLPMFTVHLWLPKAHVEAPIAGSMILAAILLKLGGYGILRVSSMFNQLMSTLSSIIISVSLIGGIATSMICLRQSDLKSLIAYSSVGHMGLMIAGAMSNNSWGMSAALAMMIAHGLSSSALFVMANMNYEMTHTRSLYLTKGLLMLIPTLTLWWFLFTAINMAAPPSINLMSEIMLMASVMSTSKWSIVPLSLMSFFSAAYSLYMYTTMTHGGVLKLNNPLSPTKSKDFSLLLMHLIPAILVISKPEIITIW